MKNVRLGDHDIAEVSAGQAAPQNPQSFGASGYPFIRAGSLEHLCSGGATSELEHIEPLVAKAHRLKLFPKDTVVFAKSGMSAKLGRVHRLQESAYVVSHLAAITPKAQLAAAYLSYFLDANPPSRLIPNEAYPSIRLSEIENITINLPPLAEQRRIAAILDKADAIRRKRQQSLELADSLLKSVFLDMFGDPVTNEKKFPIRALPEFYCNTREGTKCGPFGSALKKDEFTTQGVPVWCMDNISLDGNTALPFRLWISEEKYQQLLSYSVLKGDIIISRAGTVGKMCVATDSSDKAIISTNLIRLRLNSELCPRFFVSLITYCKGRVGRLKVGNDGAFTHMSTGVLDSLAFPYPPKPLQNKFAAIVQKVEAHKQRAMQGQQEADDLFKALQQQLFS